MLGETNYCIKINKNDVFIINNLVETLDACPISLTNNDYVDIIRAIADRSDDIDIDNIQLIYEKN